jgi:hypothetical protein
MNGYRTDTIWTDTDRATRSLNPLRLLALLYRARGSLSLGQFWIVRVSMSAVVIVLQVVVVLLMQALPSQLQQIRALIGLLLIVFWLAFGYRADLMRLRDLGYADHEIRRLYTPIVGFTLAIELSFKQGEPKSRVIPEDVDVPPA